MNRILIGILAVLVTTGSLGQVHAEQESAPLDQMPGLKVIEVHAKDGRQTNWRGFRAVLNSRGCMERIEALLRDNKRKILRMTEEEEKCTIPSITERPRLIAEDLNFDGYLDLALLCAVGATGNMDYSVWLWDPKAEILRYSSDITQILEHVKSISVDSSNKTVATMSGNLRSRLEQTYAIVDGKPLLSYSRHAEITKDGIWEVTIRKREGERMVEVKKRKSPGDSPW